MNGVVRNITIIGSGNIAGFFGRIFFSKGININSVISRNKVSGSKLASELGSVYSQEYTLPENTDLVLIAVNDDAIDLLAQSLAVNSYLVCHTAGAQPMSILNRFPQHGVLYPLQSIKGETDAAVVPVLFESNTDISRMAIEELLKLAGLNFSNADSETRLQYHLAAVFANNFSNAMLAASEKIIQNNGLNIELLKPLIRQTFENALLHSARKSQTGPAIRSDIKTMEKHLSLLENDKDLHAIYSSLSALIKSANS